MPLLRVCAVLAALRTTTPLPPPPPATDGATVAPDCWFLHGSGQLATDAGPPTTSFAEYWGDVHVHAANAGCATVSFNHVDTVAQPFDSPTLRSHTCELLCGGGDPCVIQNKIIFTHSAGNLYFASALREGGCSLDTASSNWFLVQAPALGSILNDKLVSWCRSTKVQSGPMRKLLEHLNYCANTSMHGGVENGMYASMRTDYPGLQDGGIKTVMEDYASGGMCGTRPWGIKCNAHAYAVAGGANASVALPTANASVNLGHNCLADDAGLVALDLYGWPTGVKSDGLVGLDSCTLKYSRHPTHAPVGGTVEVTYTEDFHDSWYYLFGNHEDGTCSNGDGGKTATAGDEEAGSAARDGANRTLPGAPCTGNGCHPCSWYRQMILRSRARMAAAAIARWLPAQSLQ